jgi:tetratricopeptide (TPR) repeat protein
LVDTGTLDAIWSQSYDRKMTDLVTLQSEIARNVSEKLRLKLTTSEQEKVAKSETVSVEAQQLYLKGLFHFNKRNGKNGSQEMERGIKFLKQVIEKDPNYALAHAGLAASYALMPMIGDYDAREYLPKGKEAALKAIELDPDLAEAHAALGKILLYSYDWEGAERSFLKAIEINPKYAKAHQWYADYFATRAMFDDSIKHFDIALKLDPFDVATNYMKVSTLLHAEKYDEALIQTKKFMELFPDNPRGPGRLFAIYLRKGMEREAVEQRWIAMEKWGISEAEIKASKDSYKKEGLDGFWRQDLDRQLARMKTRLQEDKNAFIKYRNIAGRYARLKDKERTLEYLNKAFQQGDVLVHLKSQPLYDFLRDEPEYQELLKKIGYPD